MKEEEEEEEENFQQAALALVWSRDSQGEQGGQAEAGPRGFMNQVGASASIPSAAGSTGRIWGCCGMQCCTAISI